LIAGSIFALTGGNIGTDFRFRDMFTPIIILFSVTGLLNFFKRPGVSNLKKKDEKCG
jgi:hypothetical protein